MRSLTSHKISGLNGALSIKVLDEPGEDNACHIYDISYANNGGPVGSHGVQFQRGPMGQVGINGVSNEALLAIVEDRLLGIQSGQFASRENAIALAKVQEALMWLHKQTRDRISQQ